MGIVNKINYNELIDINKKIEYPFSRNILVGKAKPDVANGSFIWHDLGNGIATSMGSYRLNQDTLISLGSNISGAVLIFNLGDSFTHIFKDKKEYLIKKNSFFIGFSSSDFSVEMKQKKDCDYNTLTIGIKEDLFVKLADNFKDAYKKIDEAKQNSYAILEGGTIDPLQYEIINSFKEKNIEENLLNAFYYEAKTISLLQYTIEKISNTLYKILNQNIDVNKINSLEKAKNIILSEYASQISIKDIAYKSAINECYLKKDFKAYYDMTIYEMLQNTRMENAKLLLQNDTSVKETALQVGYKHTGHFSKLFTQYYGTTPSEYKKQFL